MYTSLFFILFILRCASFTCQELAQLKLVPPRSFPYIVSIQSHEWCHGILITKNYVLTNARCVDGTVPHIRIYMGWYSYPENQEPTIEPDIQIYTASSVILHPEYEQVHEYWLYNNDIALVKLSQTIVVTQGVRPAAVADPETFYNTNLTGKYGTIFGWWPTAYLKAATVQVRPHSNCTEIFGRNYMKDRNFCIQWPAGERLCSHHSLPMEIDGNLIGLQQDDPQNNIDCMQFEYKFINILYYYNWIMKNSDLDEYLKDKIDNIKNDAPEEISKIFKPALGTTISPLTESNYEITDKKCKIDIKLACPNNKES